MHHGVSIKAEQGGGTGQGTDWMNNDGLIGKHTAVVSAPKNEGIKYFPVYLCRTGYAGGTSRCQDSPGPGFLVCQSALSRHFLY